MALEKGRIQAETDHFVRGDHAVDAALSAWLGLHHRIRQDRRTGKNGMRIVGAVRRNVLVQLLHRQAKRCSGIAVKTNEGQVHEDGVHRGVFAKVRLHRAQNHLRSEVGRRLSKDGILVAAQHQIGRLFRHQRIKGLGGSHHFDRFQLANFEAVLVDKVQTNFTRVSLTGDPNKGQCGEGQKSLRIGAMS